MQGEAEMLLMKAAEADRIGRFQLEAAIQSAHTSRRSRGEADWAAIVLLYEALSRFTSSPIVHLNRAAALARGDGAEAGLAALNALDAAVLKSYQPYWALRADLLGRLGRVEEARAAYDEAVARERDPAVIRFLSERRAALSLS
jgi:RNA polymerase sigma-70 factor (ECF subfamily)